MADRSKDVVDTGFGCLGILLKVFLVIMVIGLLGYVFLPNN